MTSLKPRTMAAAAALVSVAAVIAGVTAQRPARALSNPERLSLPALDRLVARLANGGSLAKVNPPERLAAPAPRR